MLGGEKKKEIEKLGPETVAHSASNPVCFSISSVRERLASPSYSFLARPLAKASEFYIFNAAAGGFTACLGAAASGQSAKDKLPGPPAKPSRRAKPGWRPVQLHPFVMSGLPRSCNSSRNASRFSGVPSTAIRNILGGASAGSRGNSRRTYSPQSASALRTPGFLHECHAA